ncbi:MAG: hypothetical protein S4CHLAM20_01610 [Chlamydiia bacterium]|nr:hypothetical protein [Chlamydiia bacterium]
MKKTFFLSLILFNLICSISYCDEYAGHPGYNDCNYQTNGELFFLKNEISDLKNAVIFDIGANVGNWTTSALAINNSATIFSFEPNPNTYEILLKNIGTNDNIKLHKFGFSNKVQKNKIFFTYGHISEQANSLDGLYYRPILKKLLKIKPKKISVNLSTLDNFLENSEIKKIDLLKIDTEGEEYNILCGATKALSKGLISRIQFEYGGCYIDAKTKLEDVYYLLTSFGYKIYRLLPEDKLEITKWDPILENYQYSNYIAIL